MQRCIFVYLYCGCVLWRSKSLYLLLSGLLGCSFICRNTCVNIPSATLFSLNNTAEEDVEGGKDEEKDEFQTDEDEDEEMEVDKPAVQKRKKVCRNLK